MKAFLDITAWVLIAIGLLLFVARIPLAPGGFINLPVAATVFQTAGLMFTIAGMQIFVSKMVWPDLSFTALVAALHPVHETIHVTVQTVGEEPQQVPEGFVPRYSPIGAGLALLGLFLYNGLTTIAFVMWLSSAMGAQLGA